MDHAAYRGGGDFAAVGFLDVDEINHKMLKKTIEIFVFFNSNISKPQSILMTKVSLQSWEKVLIHQVQNSKLTYLQSTPPPLNVLHHNYVI